MNKPLTIKELRLLHGKPVSIEDPNNDKRMWAIRGGVE